MPLSRAPHLTGPGRFTRAVRVGAALLLGACATASASEDEDPPLRIAVAANFRSTMDQLVEAYLHQRPEQSVAVISGSTGKLYAQILAGAPFHLFFAADDERPALLEANGMGISGSRFTYAVGVLVLWAPNVNFLQQDPIGFLTNAPDRRIAIANPELAPYGRATIQTLEHLKLAESMEQRIVRGENVAQTFHFARSGAAAAAFVALSQVRELQVDAFRYWVVPASHHAPIRQDAIALASSDAARAFLAFCQTDSARSLIEESGYRSP